MALGAVVLLAQPALAAAGPGDTSGETAPPASNETAPPAGSDVLPGTSVITSPVGSDPVGGFAPPVSSPDNAPPVSSPDNAPPVSSPDSELPDGAAAASTTPDDAAVPTSDVPVEDVEDVGALAEEPVMMFRPDPVDFGRVEVGQEGDWIDVTVLFLDDSLQGVWMYMHPSDGMVVTDQSWTSCGENACSLKVRFVPERAGEHAPQLVFTRQDNGVTVGTMRGVGVGFEPGALTAQPSTVDFGSTVIGTSSAPRTVTVRNTGSSAIDIVSSNVAGPFVVDSAGGACDPGSAEPLAAGASCQVSVVFEPEEYERLTGRLDLEGDTGDFLRVYLEGYGTDPSPITVSPEQQDFGTVDVGEQSAAETFVIRNTSDSRVFMSGAITASGPFVVADNDCVRYYEAGDSCRFDVTFAPTEPGAATGTLDVAGYASAALAGEGSGEATPQLQFEPTEVDFGHVTLGSWDEPGTRTESLTLRNVGTTMATLDSDDIAVSGPFSMDASDCFRQLIGNATCAVDVTFEPASSGSATGQVTVDVNATLVAEAQLAGSASNHAIELTPPSVDFGETASGSTSAPQRISLRNAGASAIAMAGALDATGPFVIDDTNCAGVFGTGGTCWVDITFAPTEDGSATGQFRVHADEMVVASADLTGTGGSEPPVDEPQLSITPLEYSFGEVIVGTTSAPQTFTIRNDGPVPATDVEVTVNGAFAVDGSACTTVAANSSCDVSMTFTPPGEGLAAGVLTAAAGEEVAEARVVGTGVAATGDITVTGNVDFGPVLVGWAVDRPLVFTNTGPVPVSITPPVLTGDVSEVGADCWDAPLAPGAECRVLLRYRPTATGTLQRQLEFVTSAGTLVTTLSGSGIDDGPGPDDFGAVTVGHGRVSEFPVFVSGDQNFTVDTSGLTAPFAHVSGCEGAGGPQVQCDLEVAFRPSEAGSFTAPVSIRGDDGSALIVYLTGRGVPADVAVTETNLGEVAVGSTVSGSATVTNNGEAALTITGLAADGPFGVVDASPCVTTLAPAASCQVDVSFSPTAAGAASGTLTVAHLAGTASGQLSGTGTEAQRLSVTPTAVHFSVVTVGQSATADVTVANVTDDVVPLVIDPLPSPSPFGSDTDCDESLAAGASCTITVSFTPAGAAAVGSSFTVRTPFGDGGQTVEVVVSGEGVAAEVTVDAVDFGDVAVGQTGSATATVRNDGTGSVEISDAVVAAPFAVTGSTCESAPLNPGSTCGVDVTFSPSEPGTASADLSIGVGSGHANGAVSGRGVDAVLAAGSSADFGAVLAGGSDDTTVTFTNNGNVDVALQAAMVSGPFEAGDGCTGTLAAGTSCNLTVRYTPGSGDSGSQSGSVSLTGTATGIETTATVELTGFAATTGLTVRPAAHDFGTVALDRPVPARTTTITNDGNLPVAVSVALTGEPDFTVDSSSCSASLTPGSSCDVVLGYEPTDAATHSGALLISGGVSLATSTHEISGGPVELTGSATAIALSGDGPLDFGDVPAGQQSGSRVLTVVNDGPEVGVAAVAVPDGFGVADDACTGAVLAPTASCTIEIVVSETADGAIGGDVVVTTDTGASREFAVAAASAVAVSGSLTIAPDSVDFGDVAIGERAEQQLTITNDLNVPTELTALTLGGPTTGSGAFGESRPSGLRAAHAQAAVIDGPFRLDAGECTGRVLEPGETCTVTLLFAPTSAGAADAVLSITGSRGDAEIVIAGTGAAVPPGPTVPGTDPATTPPRTTGPGATGPGTTAPGDATDGTLPVTGGGSPLPTIAVAIGLIGLGVVLVSRRRSVTR